MAPHRRPVTRHGSDGAEWEYRDAESDGREEGPDMRHQDRHTRDDSRPDATVPDPPTTSAAHETTGGRTRDDRKDGDWEDGDREDEEAPPFAEPAPQPTAFGAATVGGAVAAAAMAGRGRPEEHDVRDDDTVATGDGAVDDRLDVNRGRPTGFDQSGGGRDE